LRNSNPIEKYQDPSVLTQDDNTNDKKS
jgi:hypothetical protein